MAETKALVRIDPQLLLAKAVEGNASIETLERLVALAKDVREVQAREAWHEAMAEFQRRCPPIKKSKTAEIATAKGSYSYSYAPLDQIMETIRPVLGELGLSVFWSSRVESGRVVVFCRIAHVLGHSENSGEISMPVPDASERGGGNPAQRVGSALTYARRYSLLQVTGLSPEDDDDAASLGGEEKKRKPAGEETPREEKKRSVTFPFGKHKDEMPEALSLQDLRKEEAFWTKKVAEEDNPKYKANNQKLLDAIREAISEKTAKPESPAAPNLTGESGGPESPGAPAGDTPVLPEAEAKIVAVREQIDAALSLHGVTESKHTVWCRKNHNKGFEELDLLQLQACLAWVQTQ